MKVKQSEDLNKIYKSTWITELNYLKQIEVASKSNYYISFETLKECQKLYLVEVIDKPTHCQLNCERNQISIQFV